MPSSGGVGIEAVWRAFARRQVALCHRNTPSGKYELPDANPARQVIRDPVATPTEQDERIKTTDQRLNVILESQSNPNVF